MPESESLFGQLLNQLFGENKKGVVRHQKIDGSKLPEYDVVRRYLGPAGTQVTAEKDGWFIKGFTVNKEDMKGGQTVKSSQDETPQTPPSATKAKAEPEKPQDTQTPGEVQNPTETPKPSEPSTPMEPKTQLEPKAQIELQVKQVETTTVK